MAFGGNIVAGDNIRQLKNALKPLEVLIPNKIKKTASEFAGPCPACGGGDRFFWKNGEDSGYCRQCEKQYDNIDITIMQTGQTLPELLKEHGLQTGAESTVLKSKNNRQNTSKKSLPAWNYAIKNDPRISQYFSSRNITFSENFPIPPAIRFSEFKDKKTGGNSLSIIAAVTNINKDTTVQATHRTWLDNDLRKINRIMKGSIAEHGRGVWFFRKESLAAEKLIIGEGLETVLSAMQATGIPGVAGLDAGKMLSVELPDTVCDLYILVDEDTINKGAKKGFAGQKKSLELAEQFESMGEGRKAFLVTPSDNCFTDYPEKKDFNDLNAETIKDRFENSLRLNEIDWKPPDLQETDDNESGGGAEDIEAMVARYNKRFAAVLLSGNFAVMCEAQSSSFDGSEQTFLKKGAFLDFYCNDLIYIESPDGKIKPYPSAKIWMTHKHRRSYQRIVFDPSQKKYPADSYNLFSGWNLKRKKGKCDAVLNMMRRELCNNDEHLFRYLCAWIQQILKTPWKKTKTALIFSSGQGCGKGLFMKFLGKIFAGYYLHLLDDNQLIGRFNDLLQAKLLVFSDEAVFAGDPRAANKLKGLITEDRLTIEIKNVSAYPVDSYVNLIIASNDRHVASVDADDRRYVVFELNEDHKNDWNYFEPVWQELRGDGPAALLDWIMDQDLSDIELGMIPETAAKEEQKQRSLSSVQAFWLHVLDRGYLLTPNKNGEDDLITETIKADNGMTVIYTAGFEWPEGIKVRCSFIYDEYLLYCRAKGERYPVSSRSFWNETKMKNSKRSIFRASSVLERCRNGTGKMYKIGSLELCRNTFSDTVCQVDWHTVESDAVKPNAAPF